MFLHPVRRETREKTRKRRKMEGDTDFLVKGIREI